MLEYENDQNKTQPEISQYDINERIRRDMTPNPNVKRYMPVIPKKGVFNEWAAVLKHQDEMEREQERQEYALNKVSVSPYPTTIDILMTFSI